MIKTRAVIFLNGQFSLPGNIIRPSDFLIGVDGGSRLITSLGLRPDLIIGDLDSLPKPLAGAPIIQYPVDKDQTDSELALNYALNQDFKELMVIGFLGRRLDHVIANLMMFARFADKAEISVITNKQQFYFVRHYKQIFGKKGQIISLIPIIGNCIVTTTGLKWPLNKATLKFGTGRGVSNVMTDKKASVKVSRGTLLICYNYA